MGLFYLLKILVSLKSISVVHDHLDILHELHKLTSNNITINSMIDTMNYLAVKLKNST